MRRSDYIETREGQIHEKLKRSLDVLYLSVNQEPKSKNSITTQEKKDFRESIKKQLNKQKRKAFRGNIILEIDFQTTKDNPPAIQTLAKNYLDLKELKVLNNLVSAYFDIAEVNAIEHRRMRMADYIRELDAVLKSAGRRLLDHAGSVSNE